MDNVQKTIILEGNLYDWWVKNRQDMQTLDEAINQALGLFRGICEADEVDEEDVFDGLKDEIIAWDECKQWKLCYAGWGEMYFTSGDVKDIKGWGRIRIPNTCPPANPEVILAYQTDKPFIEAVNRCDGNYTINEVNNGIAPWLYSDKAGALNGGATLEKCIEWLKANGCKWGLLHE